MFSILAAALSLSLFGQGQPPKFHYDAEFGGIGWNYPTAAVLWAYKLVDAWTPDDPNELTGEGFAAAARPALNDLLIRMDRPIVKDIALGHLDAKPACPADELAAGIALWTVAFKKSVRWLPTDQDFAHAERELSKAARDCDTVGRSFACLARAYCLLNDKWEPPRSGGEIVHGERLVRWKQCVAALEAVYKQFYETVPARALRAATELHVLFLQQHRSAESMRWFHIVKDRFPKYHDWGSYDALS